MKTTPWKRFYHRLHRLFPQNINDIITLRAMNARTSKNVTYTRRGHASPPLCGPSSPSSPCPSVSFHNREPGCWCCCRACRLPLLLGPGPRKAGDRELVHAVGGRGGSALPDGREGRVGGHLECGRGRGECDTYTVILDYGKWWHI